MNEFDEINLPADFDDLSKHAPLLEKIRFKGEGFVVPENYFEEAGELSVSSSQLAAVGGRQSESGFIVPGNYFEELAERIIAIASLSSTADRGPQTADCFSVPEGYFEKLTDQILAVAQLSDLKTGETFEIPQSYFNELDETINTKLALDNLKQDEGFGVPENYFENFSEKILAHVAVDELGKGSDADVPQGYFDTLADRISARIAEEEGTQTVKTAERGRIIVFAEVLKRYARPVSVAASVALIISVSIWFFNRGEDTDKIVHVDPPKKNVQPVIPTPKKDSAIISVQQENIAQQPKRIKKDPTVNQQEQPVVKEVDSKDVLEQLYLLDENMVADYITDKDAELNATPQELLNDEMLNYLLENGADPSDINK
jgi:hypothetical protein